MAADILHQGGCHCGAVRFQVAAPSQLTVHSCNCSICSMTGFMHLIVPARNFKLLKGAAALHTYTFNTQVAQHKFCRYCGIKSFYIPRSNPNGFSINVNCLDPHPDRTLILEAFDGQNWEQHASQLQHLSA